MGSSLSSNTAASTESWYVLNHVQAGFSKDAARKSVERFNAYNEPALQIFAPSYCVREVVDGKTHLKNVSLTFHYVFVRGSFNDVKSLCSQSNGFSFLINKGAAERYATVSDCEMRNFMTIARAYENALPCFPLDDVDLEEGDIVEVIKGEFAGLRGTYMPRPRSKSGNILLRVFQNLGAVAYDIKVSDIRVIEYARNTTRANDQIDAFVPQLLRALRLAEDTGPLPVSVAARLTVFCRRMEVVRLDTRKLNAKLQGLLAVGNYVLGDMDAYRAHLDRYSKLRPSLTNPWTRALIGLMFSVIDNSPAERAEAFRLIAGAEASTKSQKTVVQEFEYYQTHGMPID